MDWPTLLCKLFLFVSSQALSYIGKELTPEQKNHLHNSLNIDKDGRVIYSEFVRLVQDMFPFRLEDSQLQQQLVMALSEKLSMDYQHMVPAPHKVCNTTVSISGSSR